MTFKVIRPSHPKKDIEKRYETEVGYKDKHRKNSSKIRGCKGRKISIPTPNGSKIVLHEN